MKYEWLVLQIPISPNFPSCIAEYSRLEIEAIAQAIYKFNFNHQSSIKNPK